MPRKRTPSTRIDQLRELCAQVGNECQYGAHPVSDHDDDIIERLVHPGERRKPRAIAIMMTSLDGVDLLADRFRSELLDGHGSIDRKSQCAGVAPVGTAFFIRSKKGKTHSVMRKNHKEIGRQVCQR